jgi:hypothetical protein
VSIRDRVLVANTKVVLVMIEGPPRVSWVASISETEELVERLIEAVEEAENNLHKGALAAASPETHGIRKKR